LEGVVRGDARLTETLVDTWLGQAELRQLNDRLQGRGVLPCHLYLVDVILQDGRFPGLLDRFLERLRNRVYHARARRRKTLRATTTVA
jgi:hypothetical protein